MKVDILSTITTVLGGTAAAFAQLPYAWAHIAASCMAGAIVGMHVNNTVTAKPVQAQAFWKGKNNG